MLAPPMMMSAPPPMMAAAPTYAPQANAVPAVPAAPVRPRPIIRAQAPEEPNPARPPLLTLPSPEQLGVAVRPVENSTDWSALHARMKQLGVLSFHMDSLPDGRTRFTCWMPLDQGGLTRRIESVAGTETEAVRRGLQEAAQTPQSRP
jgi:hypothetical protein